MENSNSSRPFLIFQKQEKDRSRLRILQFSYIEYDQS